MKSGSLITEDGIVIANNTNQDIQDEELNSSFAAISASILSMAERGIEIINNSKILEQIKIDAGSSENPESNFSIWITRIYSNVLLQIIFPKRIKIGLIHFEITKFIKDTGKIIQNSFSRDFFSSIGSLT
ncbi:MAG: hypothetical protein P8Y70_06010 [Candidatus Lokiarchaeota archaeon]